MAAVTTAVVATAVAVRGQQMAADARKNAAEKQRRAAAESAELIGSAGRAGEREIAQGAALAERDIVEGGMAAEREIAPYAEAAKGFDVAKQSILGGEDIGGPLADAIRRGALSGAQTAAFSPVSQSIRPEIQRQAGLAASAATPDIRNMLINQGAQGIGAIGDIAQMRSRGFDALSDLATGAAGQRASALVGAAPQLTQLAAGAREARVLSDVAGQRAQTQGLESLSRLAGRLS